MTKLCLLSILFSAQIAWANPLAFGSKLDSEIDRRYYQTYIAPLIDQNCLPCHGGESPAGGHQLDNYVEVKSHAGYIKGVLSAGTMPPNQPEWHKSDEALLLLFYASAQKAEGHDH